MADAIARRVYRRETLLQIERGQAMVRAYMAEHGVSFPEAVDALAAERRREFAELWALYAERHGLDDDQTLFALHAHCIDGTGVIQ